MNSKHRYGEKDNAIEKKERGRSYFLLVVSLCFMFFVFAPLEIYFTNKTEFWFGLKDLLPILIICFFFSLILLLALYLLLRIIKNFDVIYLILLGVFIGFYIQGNYIPRNYGVLNGTEIQWEKYSNYGMASIILWLAIIVVCGLIFAKFRKEVYKIGQYLCIFVLLIQIVTMGVLYVQSFTISKQKNVVVTDKHMLELSENKNIVVFLLDAFDSKIMRDMLETDEAEQYTSILKDFTYYPDAAGGYPTTKASLPFILTGQWYENDVPYAEYIKNAYEKTELYNTLHKNNFMINVYTNEMYLDPNVETYGNVVYDNYKVKDYLGFSKLLYSLVAFDYVPHQFKNKFVVYSDDFSKFKGATNSIYQDEPDIFYKRLVDESITTESKYNMFQFFHLSGTHPPFTFGEKVEEDGGNYDVYDEAKGCFTLLEEYFSQLRSCGIYNNTAIILMADHGNDTGNWGSDMNANPLFLLKSFDEQHDFQESDTAVSWEDFAALIQLLSDEADGSQSLNQLARASRRYLHYTWDDSWDQEYMPHMDEYMIIDRVYDNDSMVPTGRLYAPAEVENKKGYEFKENIEVPIDVENEAYRELVYAGLSDSEGVTWTKDRYTCFLINFEPGFDKDFRVKLKVSATAGEDGQRVQAFANGKLMENVTVTEDEICVEIPNDDIVDNSISLMLYYPDAFSPAIKGTGNDQRILAFLISGIICEEVE